MIVQVVIVQVQSRCSSGAEVQKGAGVQV